MQHTKTRDNHCTLLGILFIRRQSSIRNSCFSECRPLWHPA